MSEVTVSQFANVLKIPVERLISQLDEAGISVSGADDVISDDAKKPIRTSTRETAESAQPGLCRGLCPGNSSRCRRWRSRA